MRYYSVILLNIYIYTCYLCFIGKKQPVSLRTAVVQSSPQNYVSRVSSGTPKSEVIRTSPSSSSNAASKDDGDFNSLREDGGKNEKWTIITIFSPSCHSTLCHTAVNVNGCIC